MLTDEGVVVRVAVVLEEDVLKRVIRMGREPDMIGRESFLTAPGNTNFSTNARSDSNNELTRRERNKRRGVSKKVLNNCKRVFCV